MRRLSFVLFCLLLSACGEDSKQPPTKSAQGEEVIRGKRVYMAYCTSCHNSDPAKDGPIGPAVKGSSKALLEARVLRGSYPQGYNPKRKSSIMPTQPALESSIRDLAAFLK